MNGREILYELLFRALIEIRADSHDAKARKAFALADLFHNLPKNLLQERDETKILESLRERAKLKGIETWLDHATAQITKPMTLAPV